MIRKMDVQQDQTRTIQLSELQKHNTKSDCWIAVHSKVLNLTDFINNHPGGPEVLIQYAGMNATKKFDEVHAPDLLDDLPKEQFIGLLDMSSIPAEVASPAAAAPVIEQQLAVQAPSSIIETPGKEQQSTIPPLETILAAHDFTRVASTALTPKTWAFYSSAATDLITHGNNKSLLRRIMIRPRVLKDVSNVNIETTMMGHKSKAPFFICPVAMARLVHPDGELAFRRGCASEGIIPCISTNASYTLKSIAAATSEPAPFFFQLYVNSDRAKTTELLKSTKSLGVKAILVTVDAPVPGKREADERAAQATTIRSAISGGESSKDKKGSGLGRLMAQYIDKSLSWKDLAWIREASGLPIVLKGVQTAEDAKLAVEWGVDGIMVSNHGGRSLDGAQAAILVLLEMRKNCPEVFEHLEVYVDGGFERGSDILKAIALGTTAVGVGRPFLYSLVYGQEGVEHLSQILKDELEVSMRLCGITSLEQATPALLNTLDVDHLIRQNDKFAPIRRRYRAKL